MEDDQQLKNLFARLDQVVDESPVPVLDQDLNQDIHRFRSPWAKFLEWVINGGAGMLLVFGLVSLGSIFWCGMTLGWIVVPAVLFLIRPLLGETPTQHPWRMAVLLTFGSALSMAMGTVVDFATFCYPEQANTLMLGFFVENSLATLTHPEYSVSIGLLIILTIATCRWTAARYPWLDRSVPIKRWRVALSWVLLIALTGAFTNLAFKVDRSAQRSVIEKALNSPEMARFIEGENLPRSGMAAAAELKAAGLPNNPDNWQDFLIDCDPETLKRVASIQIKSLHERSSVTLSDLKLAQQLLVATKTRVSLPTDLVYAQLWWELHCFTQDYGIGREIQQLNMAYLRNVPLPPLLHPNLTEKQAEEWLQRLTERPIRPEYESGDTKAALAVHTLLISKKSQERTTGSSLQRYLDGVETRYLLMPYTSYRGWQSASDFPLFANRETERKLITLSGEIRYRLRADEHRELLTGVLTARLRKMRTGSYPESLELHLQDYQYQLTPEGEGLFVFRWMPEEVVCRLPR